MPRFGQPSLILIILILFLSACAAPTATSPASPTPYPPGWDESSLPPTSTATVAPSETPSTALVVTPGAAAHPTLPPGPINMVTIGDSLTQGDGDESGLNGYPERLAHLIELLRQESQFLNLGKSGWSSTDVINGINGAPGTLSQALEARPNLALVWIGSNDLWYLYEYGPEPMTAEAEQQDLETYAANLDSILGKLTGAGATVFIALLDDQSKRPVVASPPNPAEPAFTSITPADLARMSVHVNAMNEIIKQKAAAYGAVTVDFYHTDIFTNPATLYGDGNHPNTTGYEVITQIWYSAISEVLGR